MAFHRACGCHRYHLYVAGEFSARNFCRYAKRLSVHQFGSLLVCFTFSGYLGLYGHNRFESRDVLGIVRDVASAIFLSGLVKL